MKSKVKKLSALFLVGMSVGTLLSGCAGGSDKTYPVTIGDTQVIVGETEVGALLDAGYTFSTLVDYSSIEIYEDDMLDANSYYSSIFMDRGANSNVLMCVTTDKDSVPFSSAIVAKMSFGEGADFSNVSFDGVPITELTPDIIKEHVSGIDETEDGSSLYLTTSNYYVNFDLEDGKVVEFDIERKYNIDYSN